jgi:hypothetical protein
MTKTVAMLSLLPAVALLAATPSNSQELNLRQYLPLADRNFWTYQVSSYRPGGQVFYRLSTRAVEGDVAVDGNITARKLMDDRGQYTLVSVDERHYRIYGENEGQGVVKYAPPLTLLDASYVPGKSYAQPHVLEGEPGFSEATYYGTESIQVPAGSFKDCLKVRFGYTTPSGATHTLTEYLALGVGVVKETYEVFSPNAEQTVRYGYELLDGTVDKHKVGGEAAQTVNMAEYFPFHQGDSWTYNWNYRFADGQTRSSKRKRWFEGTKFTNAGAAFKLISDASPEDYQFYTLDKYGLRIIESSEKGTRAQAVHFYYDPALLIARDNMVIGRTYRWTQAEADGKDLIQYSTTLEGFEPVETPMGRYEHCLRVQVDWETSHARVKNLYWYARGIGIVAYNYEALSKNNNSMQIAMVSTLQEASINGHSVTTAEAGKELWDKMAADLAATQEDPRARQLFREASLNRYVWDADLGFRGFTADLVMRIDGGAPVTAQVSCSPSLDIAVDIADPQAKAVAHEEMSQFVTHRQPRKPFDAWYGPDKAKFKLGKETPIGQEVFVEGDAMGSRYVLANHIVRQLTRNIGRMEFTIDDRKQMPVEDGRYIAIDYGVTYYAADTHQVVGSDNFVDAYVKMGNYWVPTTRVHTSTMKGKPGHVELEIKNLDYLK